MSKPIVVEVAKATGRYVKGAELGFESEAKAQQVLGDGFKVVRYQDNTEYTAPKAAQKPADGKKG